jgi:hypothetical protein
MLFQIPTHPRDRRTHPTRVARHTIDGCTNGGALGAQGSTSEVSMKRKKGVPGEEFGGLPDDELDDLEDDADEDLYDDDEDLDDDELGDDEDLDDEYEEEEYSDDELDDVDEDEK